MAMVQLTEWRGKLEINHLLARMALRGRMAAEKSGYAVAGGNVEVRAEWARRVSRWRTMACVATTASR